MWGCWDRGRADTQLSGPCKHGYTHTHGMQAAFIAQLTELVVLKEPALLPEFVPEMAALQVCEGHGVCVCDGRQLDSGACMHAFACKCAGVRSACMPPLPRCTDDHTCCHCVLPLARG